ncbi:BTAD domain-containing putative transcriptional regulator [Sneathiella limimaris]|uniref:BTAD domain-containing putative transcriptional regulator n=1 Tax=Sneathiella limimaris TaxID=1964213 RepID=UPI00146A69EB|nr:BTAD domain-containing putative transcriptional regulator [Sneathiella limimaris]
MSACLYLFGGFRLELIPGKGVAPLRDKTQALIAYIALSKNGVVTRQQAATLLWEGGKDPFASLRQTVKEIRALEELYGTSIFQADTQYLSLDLNRLWVDARIASQLSKDFERTKADELVRCDLGPLLDKCSVTGEAFEEWYWAEREKRQNELLQTLETYLQSLTLKAAPAGEQRKLAHAILSVDQTNERAYRILMKSFYEEGDRATALKYYETCVSVLERELDVLPSEETESLASDIQDNRPLSGPMTVVREGGFELVLENQSKPIVQVLDFSTGINDQVLDFVSQTFKADICEQLSRNERFSVRDLPALPRDLDGVEKLPDYTVRANILSVGEQLSILLQLVDDKTGDILWMKRITPEMSSLLQGKNEQALLAAVEIYRMIELKETDRAMKAEESHLTARQCLLRAVAIMFRFSKDAVEEAERYLLRALTQSPGYPEALAWLAFLRSIELGQGYSTNPEATKDETGELVRRSIELNPSNDIALAIAGHLEAFVHHDFETALEFFDRSLAANQNCAYTWGFSAITHCYIGKPTEALDLLSRCRQIMPFDSHPYYFDTARCIASMLSGKYEDAVRIGRQVLRNNPNFYANYRPLLSSLGHLGRVEEATPVLEEFAKHQPEFSIDWHLKNYPPLEAEITERYIRGLRKAGVSES